MRHSHIVEDRVVLIAVVQISGMLLFRTLCLRVTASCSSHD
jgi:predicted methyltransferase MtxX (methanogen marker protein 4)